MPDEGEAETKRKRTKAATDPNHDYAHRRDAERRGGKAKGEKAKGEKTTEEKADEAQTPPDDPPCP